MRFFLGINREYAIGRNIRDFIKKTQTSQRKDNLLVSINCAAIPSELMESELFGYEEGAFTGGAMPLHMQAKLLRVLEEKEGGYYPIPVDIRIIEALNKDLKKASKSEKKFREDLYYRLNVINIRIPPLRERKEDIMVFSNYFF